MGKTLRDISGGAKEMVNSKLPVGVFTALKWTANQRLYKRCKGCIRVLLLSHYDISPTSRDGLKSSCKRCLSPKRCSSCHELFERTNFYKCKNRSDGLHSYCKPCAVKSAVNGKRKRTALKKQGDVRMELVNDLLLDFWKENFTPEFELSCREAVGDTEVDDYLEKIEAMIYKKELEKDISTRLN